MWRKPVSTHAMSVFGLEEIGKLDSAHPIPRLHHPSHTFPPFYYFNPFPLTHSSTLRSQGRVSIGSVYQLVNSKHRCSSVILHLM